MPDKIRPEEAQTETQAFKTWVEMLTSFAPGELNDHSRKFLDKAQEHLVLWLISKSASEMDKCVSHIVSAIVYDDTVAPVLGAYIAWGRAAIRDRGCECA